MSDDLVAFLRARLDEDERMARAAAEPERWAELNRQPRPQWYVQLWADPDRTAVIADPESSAFPVVVSIEGMDEDDAQNRVEHIARHDPARVLQDVKAKRQIVDIYAAALEERTTVRSRMREAVDKEFWRLHQHESSLIERARILTPTVHALATVYADHPDYRPEWRP